MQFVNMYRVDLKGGPAVVPLKQMFYGDAGANRIGAVVTDGGEEVQLSGTCGGTAVLANGGTVVLTGEVSGSEAYVELPAAAYAVEGAIQVFVYVEQEGQITTLVAGFGNVRMTDTDTIIDPGTVVPSLAELMSKIAEMEAATVNANAAAANASESAEAYNAIITELDGTVYTQYLRDANMTEGEYYTLSDGVVTETESSAQKRWEPIELPAGTYTYLRIVGYYSYVDDGTTITKLRDTTGTNSSPITVTFSSPVTLYVSASTTSAGNNAMLCNGSSVPESYVEGAYSAELTRVDELDADVSDLKSAIEQMETILLGDTTTPTPETENLNLAENGTVYVSSSSYRTSYIPIQKNQKCVFTIVAAKAAEIRFGLAPQEPKASYKATYLGKINLTANSTGTYEYTPTEDGFVSASYWYDVVSSLTITLYDGGIVKDASEVPGLESLVCGEADSLTQTKVSGLNFAENDTKYTASGNYETWYVPVIVGNEYVFAFDNSSSNAYEVRFALSDDIPAANVAGTYLSKLNIVAHSVAEKTLTANKGGYLGVTWYTSSGRDLVSVKEISGGLVQRVNVSDAKSAEIGALADAIEDINDELTAMKGQEIQLESGTYWGATTVGTSVESQIQTATSSATKRTTLTLPANKVLRIMGVGVSDLTRLYWVFSASTGILIDIADATDQLAPRGYYLRYNEDTHIYINCVNAYDHFIGIVDDISPWVDISRCIGQTTRKIIDFGERDIRYAVRNMKRKSRNGSSYAPALFLHFSDIHGDAENLTRLMEFASDKHISNYLSDILCTGDVVKSTIDDGMTWFDAIDGTNKILLLPGNHDSVKGTASSPTNASKQEMYETLFEGRVSNWNVTQPSDAATAYKGYYYKDYAANKLRLICLDSNGSGDYQTAETAWLEDTLEAAYELGYAVVCANHFMFATNTCTGVHCTFHSDEAPENEGSWVIPTAYINAVETFIGYGGEFVCWLGGHVHKDRLWLHNNEHQLCVGVTTASHETHQISYEDSERIAGDKSQDAFNIIGFDTFAKRITILKIGSDLTRMMAHKGHLCIDYTTRTVLFND